MIFIALVFMLSIFAYEYRISKKYVLHPTVIVTSVFSLSIIVAGANYRNWGDISFITLVVLFTGISMFCIGGYIASFSFECKGNTCRNDQINNYKLYVYDIKNYKTILVICFMAVVTLGDYKDVLSYTNGSVKGLLDLTTSVRMASYRSGELVKHSSLLQQGLYVCRMLAYLYSYMICQNLLILHRKINILYCIPVFLYLIQALLSTGRTEFIYILYGILVIAYYLNMSQKKWVPKGETKFFKYIVAGTAIFLFVFLSISNSRVGKNVSPLKTLSTYIGSPIYALNTYINNYGIHSNATHFGAETQSLYYSLMRAYNGSSISSEAVLPPVYIGAESSMTNIYTAIRRYLHDFGLFGMCFIMLLLGWIYSKLFNSLKSHFSPLRILVYSFISYSLVEIAIEERFFSNFVTARSFYCIFYLVILYILLFERRESD